MSMVITTNTMFAQVFIAALFALAAAENCPSGGEIYARGISNEGKIAVINAHNDYRIQIANGLVPNQPRGVNLQRMIYDQVLGEKGRVVSDTCKMNHILAQDDRWWWVGQNLYIQWSSQKDDGRQDWETAVAGWFNEHEDFTYPNISVPGKMTGHYTQVVWADSKSVGCDFIYFYDVDQPQYPYAKLYTCNYGPGGNVGGQVPYETGTSGCEDLC